MRPFAFFIATAALLGSGCAGDHQAPPAALYVYRVGPDDVLAITVMREPELTRERLVVGPDGVLGLPGIDPVKVGGKTLIEAAQIVRAAYEKAMLTKAQVGLTLIEMRSNRVLVMGEVRLMAPIPFREGMSITEAIATVGGYIPNFAKLEDCRIIRGAKAIPVDLEDVFDGEEKDVDLEPGDIVVVPPKWITRFDRYVTQLFAPLRFGAATAASTATVGTTVGTTTLVGPGF